MHFTLVKQSEVKNVTSMSQAHSCHKMFRVGGLNTGSVGLVQLPHWSAHQFASYVLNA